MKDKKDKLDILIELIQKGNNPDLNYENLLKSLAFNSDAFLFLYESLPESVRPQLKNTSSSFKDLFIDAISQQDEKTFNQYFFSEIHELLSFDKIRELHLKLPQNKRLKDYFKSKDTPKNIDDIIQSLYYLWAANSDHYSEMLEQYLPKLMKISHIKSSKSRAAENFCYWGNKMIKKEGIDSFFKFCEKINVEPYIFCLNTTKNFGLKPEEMNIEDLKKAINYGEIFFKNNSNYIGKSSYQYIQQMSSYAPIILFLKQVSYKNTPENLEKFSLIWNTQQQHIKSSFNKLVYNTINVNTIETIDLITQVSDNIFTKNKTNWYSDLNLYKSDIERIISWGKYTQLNHDIPTKEIENKKRIKI